MRRRESNITDAAQLALFSAGDSGTAADHPVKARAAASRRRPEGAFPAVVEVVRDGRRPRVRFPGEGDRVAGWCAFDVSARDPVGSRFRVTLTPVRPAGKQLYYKASGAVPLKEDHA